MAHKVCLQDHFEFFSLNSRVVPTSYVKQNITSKRLMKSNRPSKWSPCCSQVPPAWLLPAPTCHGELRLSTTAPPPELKVLVSVLPGGRSATPYHGLARFHGERDNDAPRCGVSFPAARGSSSRALLLLHLPATWAADDAPPCGASSTVAR